MTNTITQLNKFSTPSNKTNKVPQEGTNAKEAKIIDISKIRAKRNENGVNLAAKTPQTPAAKKPDAVRNFLQNSSWIQKMFQSVDTKAA